MAPTGLIDAVPNFRMSAATLNAAASSALREPLHELVTQQQQPCFAGWFGNHTALRKLERLRFTRARLKPSSGVLSARKIAGQWNRRPCEGVEQHRALVAVAHRPVVLGIPR